MNVNMNEKWQDKRIKQQSGDDRTRALNKRK
jgi:hypothetical protein